MSLVIDHRLEIAAPPDVVWDVLTDFDRYGEWNPFVVACRTSLEPGSPIAMRVHVFRAFAQPQTETILEHAPGRAFAYGIAQPLGALRSRRSHGVEPAGEGRTRYVSHFELGGWLAPLVRGLLGARLRRGFGEMSAAVAARAEVLAGGRGAPGRG